MEQNASINIYLITSLIVILLAATIITLFVVFQRRKNKLLEEKAEEKKQFEKEISETQIEIREETLRNISWELHDNIGQLLTLAKIQLQNATEASIPEISKTITKSLKELRALSKLINPEFIKNIKLKDAITLEVERFNRLNYLNASIQVNGKEKDIEQKHGIIIFRMLQEFFSNTIKHSKASTLNVTLNYSDTNLEIISKDNGVGFDSENTSLNGIGLQNIKKRAELIKATANLISSPKKGTSLTINYYF